MGLSKTLTITLVFCCSMLFSFEHKNHILYLMNIKEYQQSVYYYQKLYKETKEQDFELLQQMALLLLEAGAKSQDPKERQMTMFGAGLAASTRSLKILEKGIFSPEMETQLTALHFICALQDNDINTLLVKAMGSDFLETRIEAAVQLAIRKHPCAFGQIQSLMQKLPPFLKPIFPQFFGLIGTSDSTRVLKALLYDEDPNVRVQSIITIANSKRDDLLYLLRKKIKHSSIAEQEALATSIALLNDSSCNEELKKYCGSSTENVKLAASLALYNLGDKSFENEILKEAIKENLFAILSLGNIENSENILAQLSKSPNTQARINASIALLKRKDPRSLKGLKELFISKENDLAIAPYLSLGKTLSCFKVMKNSKNRKNIDTHQSLQIKEMLLKQAIELNEDSFLSLAEEIFNNNQNDLVPYLCHLLSNLNSDKAIEFLKNYSVKTGSPLVRDYCNLTLYRMNIEGPYFEYLKKWLHLNSGQELIRLKPFTPDKVRYDKSQYSLSPEESSFLLVEMLSVLGEKHSIEGIMLLLDCLKTTNNFNRYPLAGILLRATE